VSHPRIERPSLWLLGQSPLSETGMSRTGGHGKSLAIAETHRHDVRAHGCGPFSFNRPSLPRIPT
jgi:hypothetical protein